MPSASCVRHAEGLDRARDLALLGDLVQRELRRLYLRQRSDIGRGIKGARRHVATDADHLAEQRQVVDLLGEVARRDQRAGLLGQLGEVSGAADLLHRLVALEQRLQGDRGGDHVAIRQRQDLLVDAAVQRLVEMLRSKLEHDVLDEPVVDHQRAEQRRLRLQVLGQRGGLGGGRYDSQGHLSDHRGACRSPSGCPAMRPCGLTSG